MKLAGDGRFELFKSSKVFDGPVHRKQHGFDAGAHCPESANFFRQARFVL